MNINQQMINFFKNGFFIHKLTLDEQKRVATLSESLVASMDKWRYDIDETDVIMPPWCVFSHEHAQRELVLNTYLPIIQQYKWMFDDFSDVTEVCVHAGLHIPAMQWHTDYADSHRSDIFILAYPNIAAIDGGELLVGERTLYGTFEEFYRFTPTPTEIIVINNMSPFFVHKVEPMKSGFAFDRILCLVGWRRNALAHRDNLPKENDWYE